MKKGQLIFVIFLILIIIISIVIVLCYNKPQDNKQLKPSEKIQKEDGVVTNIWIDEERINNLIEHKIKYLFVDIGDTGKNGSIESDKQEIIDFLNLIDKKEKEDNYSFILLPYSEINTYNYNVNSKFEENFISNYKNLIELGFDGIYVDIEPVKIGEENKYLNLLEKLNSEIPEGKIISVYSGAVSKVNERSNEWEWNIDYYKKVSDKVDLIFVPGYDSGFDNKKEYQNYIKEQIKILYSRNFSSKFMLGIPTHKQEPETIENALEAYSEMKNSNNQFIGIGIFAEWTTDENEWKIFEAFK